MSASIEEIKIIVQTIDSEGDVHNQTLYDLPVVAGFICQECGEFDEEGGEALYDCGSCGAVFTKNNNESGTHRCDCGKFASKRADTSCVKCEEGEIDPAEAVECPGCNEWIVAGEFAEHFEGCN